MESRKRAPHSKSINKDLADQPPLPDRRELVEDIMKNRLYASKEVSALLDISYQTLRRSIAKGSIKTVRVGRFVRIPAEEVMRLMKGETTLLTVQEVAAMLQVSTFTVRALIKAGKIDAFRLADQGPFRIRESEMKRIAQEGITK
jgi:excisionase family DNA binding protein